MTREERTKLINHLKYNRSIGADYLITDKDADEIIKALEQEPCDDAISRQAVLDLVADYDLSMGQVVKGIHDLPSVTPQPKMGRWIMSDDGLYRPICNNCGAHPWKGYIPTVEEATDVFKYCPNCGANMSEIPTVEEGSDKE